MEDNSPRRAPSITGVDDSGVAALMYEWPGRVPFQPEQQVDPAAMALAFASGTQQLPAASMGVVETP